MRTILSKLQIINIQLQRLIDHLWRKTTGLPTAKRSKITPNLFLGGQYNLHGIRTLKKWGVTAVVNMRVASTFEDVFRETGFKYLNLPTPDMTAPSMADLNRGVEFIKNEVAEGGKVYIHCKFGEGRGPTMIIAYLMSTGLTYEDALSQVKKVRTFIKPTKPQVERLREFEKHLKTP